MTEHICEKETVTIRQISEMSCQILRSKIDAILGKKKQIKAADEKIISLKADQNLFAHEISGKSRDINLKEVLIMSSQLCHIL